MKNTYRYYVYLTDSKDHTIECYHARKTAYTEDIKRNALDAAHFYHADKVYIYGRKNNDDKDHEKIICSFDFTQDGWSREWKFYNQWEF